MIWSTNKSYHMIWSTNKSYQMIWSTNKSYHMIWSTNIITMAKYCLTVIAYIQLKNTITLNLEASQNKDENCHL